MELLWQGGYKQQALALYDDLTISWPRNSTQYPLQKLSPFAKKSGGVKNRLMAGSQTKDKRRFYAFQHKSGVVFSLI